MAYIYKITNQINGKVYIGKTVGTIETRWREHKHEASKERNRSRPIYRALNKYGLENFTVEEIEQCDISILDKREQYWIRYYRSYVGWDDCNGYNATIGGDGRVLCDYDLVYSLWKKGYIIKEISQQTGYDIKTVRTILNERGVAKEERAERANKSLQKRCGKVDLITGEILAIYNSTREAEAENRNTKHIADVCNGKRKTCKGYRWIYLD